MRLKFCYLCGSIFHFWRNQCTTERGHRFLCIYLPTQTPQIPAPSHHNKQVVYKIQIWLDVTFHNSKLLKRISLLPSSFNTPATLTHPITKIHDKPLPDSRNFLVWIIPDLLYKIKSWSDKQGGNVRNHGEFESRLTIWRSYIQHHLSWDSRLGTMINFSDPSLLFLTPPVLIFLVCILDSHSRFFFRGEGYWSFGTWKLKIV